MGVVRPPGGSRETRCNTFRGMLHGAGLEWAPDLRPVRCRFFRLVGGHAPYRRSGGGGTSACRPVHDVQQRPGGRLSYVRSEEHTSELQSLMRISYAVFCLKKKNNQQTSVTS